MRALQPLSDPDKGSVKYLIWAMLGIALYTSVYVLGPETDLYFNSERKFAEAALRQSPELKGDFEYVSQIKAVANPARGRRGVGQHAWQANEQGGYFTFEVSGFDNPKLTHGNSREYRVFFSRTNGEPSITAIQRNAPWLKYGEEPSISAKPNP